LFFFFLCQPVGLQGANQVFEFIEIRIHAGFQRVQTQFTFDCHAISSMRINSYAVSSDRSPSNRARAALDRGARPLRPDPTPDVEWPQDEPLAIRDRSERAGLFISERAS
jgi:hypothetical protein